MDIQIVGQDYIGGVHEIHENREILFFFFVEMMVSKVNERRYSEGSGRKIYRGKLESRRIGKRNETNREGERENKIGIETAADGLIP